MNNEGLLRKIYCENKTINRNVQRLAHIGLIGLLGKGVRECKAKGEKQGRLLCKVGLLLIGISELLLMVCDVIDYRKAKAEEVEEADVRG